VSPTLKTNEISASFDTPTLIEVDGSPNFALVAPMTLTTKLTSAENIFVAVSVISPIDNTVALEPPQFR
jgi:hypothetical protein